MNNTQKKLQISLCTGLVAFLAGCGGSSGGSAPTPVTPVAPVAIPVASFELVDPTPGDGNKFGEDVVLLSNGNIVVSDPGDPGIPPNGGAVHLYNPFTQTLVASIYGLCCDITALVNGNYVIASPYAEVDTAVGIGNGSVVLVNGETGVQIGTAIVGDNGNDQLGGGGVTALANGNYVIASPNDNVEDITNPAIIIGGGGSVRLVNGDSGVQIGTAITGDNLFDGLGSSGVTALTNSNYVIASGSDAVNGINDAGSIRLVDGGSGVQIGVAYAGGTVNEGQGFNINYNGVGGGVTALPNDNFVIVSPFDNVNGIAYSGSVRLIDGSSAVQLGVAIEGDDGNGNVITGLSGVTVLASGDYVITSSGDVINGKVDAGSVRLMDGSTGLQIGATVEGDDTGDFMGSDGIVVLANDNYVIASGSDDVNTLVDAGSVRLMNAATGATISIINGDDAKDNFGFRGVTALANNNYVITSPMDDVGGIVNAGSTRVMNGVTGLQVGLSVAGDERHDDGVSLLAAPAIALENNNFVVASPLDTVNGIVGAGSIALLDGNTGALISVSVEGDNQLDTMGANTNNIFFGVNRSLIALESSNYVIVSKDDTINGIVNAGSVILADGSTGVPIERIAGSVTDEIKGVRIITPAVGDYFIMSLPLADNNGSVDSGQVRLITP